MTDDRQLDIERTKEMGRLCGELNDRLDGISETMTNRVRMEIPSYAQVPWEEHRRTIRETARTLLASLADGTDPTSDQLRAIQAASRRRSYYGLPVYDVLAAFHIVARELWEELRRAAGERDEAVIELVAPMWLWIQAMSTIVADVYAEDAGARHGNEVVLRQRLLELLRGGGASDERTSEAARQLGFNVAGPFQSFCAPAEEWSQGQIELLSRAAKRLPGTVHCGLHGSLMIVLGQGSVAAEVTARVMQLGGAGTRLGIGLVREGLLGAETSIIDAERALSLAPTNGAVVDFEEDWLFASLADSRERLQPLFTLVQRVARENPGLADAVLAFSRCGFSLSMAAAELHIHPNTVGYRLVRWHELTGLDPRSFAGLSRSVLGLGITHRS